MDDRYLPLDDVGCFPLSEVVDRCRVEAHALGITPKISDAELVTLAVMQSLLGHTSERRWLRYARANLLRMFPDLPGQSGYNKRLRKLVDTMSPLVSMLGADTQIADDDLWVVDSTPVECGRSRETAKRSDVARMGQIRLLRLPLQILVGAAAPNNHSACDVTRHSRPASVLRRDSGGWPARARRCP